MKTTKIAFSALTIALIGAFATAAQAQDSNPAAYDIVMGTGPKDKGYQLLGIDVVKACNSNSFSIQNLETKGGSDNLGRLAKGEADVVFVQLDTLEAAAKDRPAYREFRAVASVNSNLLHGLTAKGGYNFKETDKVVPTWGGLGKDNVIPGKTTHVEINNMTDLKGYTVAAVGTAADVLNDLIKANNLDIKIVDRNPKGGALTDEEAMGMVKEGKVVVAMFTVSGWPHGKLKEAAPINAGLTTINFNLAPQAKQQIVTVDYDALSVRGARFVGIPNLIVTQGYEKGTTGYNNVAKFQACLMSNWKNLRNTRGMHPGWKEASDPTNTYGWPKFEGAATAPVSKKK